MSFIFYFAFIPILVPMEILQWVEHSCIINFMALLAVFVKMSSMDTFCNSLSSTLSFPSLLAFSFSFQDYKIQSINDIIYGFILCAIKFHFPTISCYSNLVFKYNQICDFLELVSLPSLPLSPICSHLSDISHIFSLSAGTEHVSQTKKNKTHMISLICGI